MVGRVNGTIKNTTVKAGKYNRLLAKLENVV